MAKRKSALRLHAEHELALIGDADEPMQREINKCLLKLVDVFDAQGHSGSSGAYTISALKRLLAFEPLTPLQGTEEEWLECADGLFQNKRCGRVFRSNGQAYDIEGIVFREPSGTCYTSWRSRTPVVFPYTPTTVFKPAAEEDLLHAEAP